MSEIKIYNSVTQKWEVVASNDSKAVRVTNPAVEASNVDEAIGELSTRVDNLKNNVAWIYKNGTIGGGGGGNGGGNVATGKIVTSVTNDPHYISTNENFSFNYMVQSRANTNFNLTLKLDQQSSINITVKPNQWYTWEIGRLIKGNHTIFITGVDVDQMPIDSVTINVIAGALELTSTFDDRVIFNVASDINIPYTVSSYLTTPINVESSINLTPQPTLTNVEKDKLLTYSLGKRPVGTYNVEIEALSSGFNSNRLEYTINVGSTTDLFLSVKSNIKKVFNRGIPIKFEYSIAVLGYTAFVTHYTIDGKSGSINSRLGSNIFEIPSDNLQPGQYVLKLTANDADNVITTKESLDIPITITASDFVPWEPKSSGLVAHFKSRGMDSSFTDSWANSIVGSPITCSLTGINGSSNGFLGSSASSSIDKSLVINGEAFATINYTALSDDKQVLTNGLTINILYKVSNVGNKNARVFDLGSYNENTDKLISGLFIDTENSEIRTIRTSTSAKIAEDEWVNQSFVIDQKFLKIYNNGIITAVVNHEGFLIDRISHEGLMYLGSRLTNKLVNNVNTKVMTDFSDCFIKEVKIYNRGLTSNEIAYNYIGDEYYLHTVLVNGVLQFDEDKQKALRALNSMNDNGEFQVDTTATSPFPILEIKFSDNDVAAEFKEYSERTVWASNVNKFKEFPCIINYSDHANKRYLNNHIGYITLQGTSSTGYTSKNYELYLGKMNDGVTNFLYSPKNDWLPENQFTLKCNMMDSSHANNIGTGRLINGGYFRDPVPPRLDTNNNNRTKIKDAVDGFPIILEIAMGRTNEGGQEDNYMGIYTFNMGRGSFYNLGLKNADFIEENGIVTSFTDKPTGLYAPSNCFAYEISTSNNNGAGAFKQQSDEWIREEFKAIYPLNDSSEGFNQLKNVVKKTSDSGSPVIVTDLQGNPIKDAQGNDIYTPGGLQFTEQSVWNLPSLADYLILSYMLGMVDNLGKNLLMKTWQKVGAGAESNWYTTFYDMDTILGLDNVGLIKHGVDVDIDSYPTGNFVVDQNDPANRGRGDYNLSDSRLWELYRRNYYRFETRPENEANSFNLLQRYTNLRKSGMLSYDNIVNKYMSVIETIGQTYYNRDAEIKYMNLFQNANGVDGYHNLSFLHGTREHYTKLWIKRRLTYLDSIFDASSNQMPGNTSAKGLKFRFNVGGQAIGNRILDVSSLSPTFITIHWKGEDDITDFTKLLVKQGEFTRFEKTFSAGTQSTNMNFGAEVLYLNSLNVGNPSYLDLSNASRLISLDLSGNRFLQAINLDGCVSLRNLDLRNCTKLGEGASEDPRTYINVAACLNLQNLDISNTKLVQVSLPKGGTLKTFKCNNTLINEVDLSNQSFLEEVDLTNCTNLTKINLSNCKQLKKITLTNTALSTFLASNCPNLEIVDISYSKYLKSINFNLTPKMKELNISYCNNAELTELNLIGCQVLETLDMTSCSAKLLRFFGTITTFKKLLCENSNLEQTKFGSAPLDVWNGNPAVNLAQLTGLTNASFANCKNLKAVTNMNLTLTNATRLFFACNNLLRITGRLKVIGSMSQCFMQCTLLKLNTTTMSGSNVVLPSDTGNFVFNLDVADVTTADSAFNLATSMDLGDMYYFMRRLNKVTNLGSCFMQCTGIKTTATQPLPENIFEKCLNLVTMSYFMYNCTNLAGDLPVRIFNPLKKVTTMFGSFTNCNITGIDQSIFIECIALKNIGGMFQNNKLSNTVAGKNMFIKNVALETADSAFSSNTNFGVVLEDDTLFRFNPNLINIDYMFSNCKVSGQLHPNLFGGVEPVKQGVENEIPVTYRYPVTLVSANGVFMGTNITGSIPATLFKNIISLQYVANFFKDTSINGTIPEDLFRFNVNLNSVEGCFRNSKISGQIPENLLRYNLKITNVSALFASCIEMISTIPENLFKYNSGLIIVNSLFSGCTKLYGQIPENLFKTIDSNSFDVFLRVTDGSNLFAGCYNMYSTIPENLFKYMPNLITLEGCFNDMGSIANNPTEYGLYGQIPVGLLYGLYNLVNINSLFNRCNKLTPVVIKPENPLEPDIYNMMPVGFFRDNGKIETARLTFAYNSGLSGAQIPLGVFNPLTNIIDMSNMFQNSMRAQVLDPDLFKFNNRLTTINGIFTNDSVNGTSTWNTTLPSGLFKKYTTSPSVSGNPLKSVSSAFSKNLGLKGEAIKFWEFGTVITTTNAYYNCTGLSNYGAIPANYK